MTFRKLICAATITLLAAACGPEENNGNNGDNNGETNAATNNGSNNGANAATNNESNGATNAGSNNGAAVSFEMEIAPLVDMNCNKAGCHASPGQAGFAIEGDTPADIAAALDGVMASSSDNQLIDPSAPSSSEVYVRISGMARTQMPLGGELGNDDVQLVEDWIAAGAPFDN